MAFEQQPGQFALFKNDKKEKESHPDYRGDGMAPDGTAVWVSAWLKVGKNGKFMSCSMKAKDEQQSRPEPAKATKSGFEDLEDDIPF